MDSKLEFMVDSLDSYLVDFSVHGGSMLDIGRAYDSDPDGVSIVLYAPFIRNAIENQAFTCYALDCMRKEKINKVIELMVAAGPIMCNDFATQCEIYNQVGIDSDTFTDEEVEYIVGEVAKRL